MQYSEISLNFLDMFFVQFITDGVIVNKKNCLISSNQRISFCHFSSFLFSSGFFCFSSFLSSIRVFFSHCSSSCNSVCSFLMCILSASFGRSFYLCHTIDEGYIFQRHSLMPEVHVDNIYNSLLLFLILIFSRLPFLGKIF